MIVSKHNGAEKSLGDLFSIGEPEFRQELGRFARLLIDKRVVTEQEFLEFVVGQTLDYEVRK